MTHNALRHRQFLSDSTRTIISVAVLSLLVIGLCQPVLAARDVRVGLHEIKPSLYTDDRGEPAGIFVDLIRDIAGKEGWNIIWVHGTFQENLNRLASGEIDLIMALTDTPDREKIYDFSKEAAVSSWTQVYAPPGAGIDTILDLDGRRVAVLRGDVNAVAFRDYAEKFNIYPQYLELDTLSDVFSQAAAGNADVAVASRIAGQQYVQKYGLTTTTVMFYPNPLGFAVPKGKNGDLLQAIDRYLADEKGNPSSFYSRTMEKWFGEKAGWVIPPYLWWGLGAAVVLIALFVGMSILLRREVRRKTLEVSQRNEELQAEIASRTRADQELVRKNEELQAAYSELTAVEEELRTNFHDLRRSEQALMQARKKLNLLNTLTFQDLQNAVFSLSGFLELAREAGCSDAAKGYIERGAATLRSVGSSLRFAKNYQDMGISQPRWQNVNNVFLYAISHLDLTGISRTMDLKGLEIYADPLLERVFTGLVENVIQHAAGATAVTLRFRKCPDEDLVILVEDNGKGIPASEKEKVFERGYAKKGGAGLFLAREILSITGISIRETGTEGTGARFELVVPKGAWRFATKDSA